MSLFSGVIYTLPDLVDPIDEISHAENIADNLVSLLVIGTVFIVYVILLVWSRYQDDKDISRVKYKVKRITISYIKHNNAHYRVKSLFSTTTIPGRMKCI